MNSKTSDKITGLLDKLNDFEVPDEVTKAADDIRSDISKTTKVGWRAFFYKDGQFSKTATFVTMANSLILLSFVLSFFQGNVINLGLFEWSVPGFDAGAAAAVGSIFNLTYVGNNAVKAYANGHEE